MIGKNVKYGTRFQDKEGEIYVVWDVKAFWFLETEVQVTIQLVSQANHAHHYLNPEKLAALLTAGALSFVDTDNEVTQ